MAKSYYLDNVLLSAVLQNSPYTSPTTVYVALFTATPGPNGGGTEVSGGGYARTPCTFGSPTNGSLTNNASCTFAQATTNWGTITSFGLYDTLSGGNLLYYGNLSATKTINTGDQITFAAGGITVTES